MGWGSFEEEVSRDLGFDIEEYSTSGNGEILGVVKWRGRQICASVCTGGKKRSCSKCYKETDVSSRNDPLSWFSLLEPTAPSSMCPHNERVIEDAKGDKSRIRRYTLVHAVHQAAYENQSSYISVVCLVFSVHLKTARTERTRRSGPIPSRL